MLTYSLILNRKKKKKEMLQENLVNLAVTNDEK